MIHRIAKKGRVFAGRNQLALDSAAAEPRESEYCAFAQCFAGNSIRKKRPLIGDFVHEENRSEADFPVLPMGFEGPSYQSCRTVNRTVCE
jgi:hypothetical protein